jgi:hypothetical protein
MALVILTLGRLKELDAGSWFGLTFPREQAPTMTPPFVTFILDILSSLGDVRSRAMFGGHGIYHDGVMIGLIASGVSYLNVDDGKHMSVSVLLRFFLPFKSFWFHETACVKLMVNEANDRSATL